MSLKLYYKDNSGLGVCDHFNQGETLENLKQGAFCYSSSNMTGETKYLVEKKNKKALYEKLVMLIVYLMLVGFIFIPWKTSQFLKLSEHFKCAHVCPFYV